MVEMKMILQNYDRLTWSGVEPFFHFQFRFQMLILPRVLPNGFSLILNRKVQPLKRSEPE